LIGAQMSKTRSRMAGTGPTVAARLPAAAPDPAASGAPRSAISSLEQSVVVTFDRDLRYLSVGGTGFPAVGLAPDMMVGRTIFDVFSPDVVAVLEPLYRAAVDGRDSVVDVRLDDRIYSQCLAPVRDAGGGPLAAMGLGLDVTEARAAEQALRESEERFRVAFEQGPLGKAHITLDGRFERVNAAMCRVTGYTQQQLQELNAADLTVPEDVAAWRAATDKLVAGESTSYTLEKRYLTAGGRSVWVAEAASLVRQADGTPRYFIVQVQDITERKAQERLLSEERRRLHEAQSIGRVGAWEMDVESTAVTWSDTLFELYGLDPAAFAGNFEAALSCVYPADRKKVDAAIDACGRTGEPLRVVYRLIRSNDGELRIFDARGQRLTEPGRPVRLAGAVADVTEVTAQVLAEAEASAASAFQQAVISASPDIIYVYDVDTRTTVWTNRSLTDLLGYSAQELEAMGGSVIDSLVPEGDQALFEAALVAACQAQDGHVIQLDHRMFHANGVTRWFSQRTTPLHRDEWGQVTQLVGALRDITDAVASQMKMEHVALHDGLTGLPNRALLIDRLEVALARGRRDRREVAVLFCDLDGFKRVNDTAGHAAGDAVLLECSQRLKDVLRAGDTVARVGGDEFVVVVEPWNRTDVGTEGGSLASDQHPTKESDNALALLIATRTAEALRKPIAVDGIEHVVTASIGIAHGKLTTDRHEAPPTADHLLQDADAAMYWAKGRGKDRFEVFEHGMRTDLAERGRVEQVLRTALRSADASGSSVPPQTRGLPQLLAAYQPVFDGRTGDLVSFEALARLVDSDGRDIPPDSFIAVAEDTGIIRPLGALMLDFACRQLATWRRQTPGLDDVTMAVNVSALQAQHLSLGGDVHRALTDHHLVPGDLVLELTETALLQAAQSTITNLRVLRDEGIGIAIDDFGTGYASLRYLATLPVSAVKVDKSFTAGLPSDGTSCKIVTAVAGLAADMDLDCIIEGVETHAQRAVLPPGVQLQGWLTGRPARPDQLDLRDLVSHGAR
jgi:PAS domain S-box-containing protein